VGVETPPRKREIPCQWVAGWISHSQHHSPFFFSKKKKKNLVIYHFLFLNNANAVYGGQVAVLIGFDVEGR
jgi:hypothetical protein